MSTPDALTWTNTRPCVQKQHSAAERKIIYECWTGELECSNTGEGWEIESKPDSGPTTKPSRREAVERAKEIAREINDNPGILEVNSIGSCGNLQGAGIGMTLDGTGCWVYDGDEVTVLAIASQGLAASSPSVGVGSGPLISNAEHTDQLLGLSICVGAGAAHGIGGAGELCLGLDDEGEFTGIWTLWGAVTIAEGAEAHYVEARANEVASLSLPCIDLPDIGDGPDLPNGPKIPLIGWDLPDGPDLSNGPDLPAMGCG